MVSIKTKYAIAVITKMAIEKEELFSIKHLAETCDVPKKYLEQILNALRKAGIVKSIRGIQGGYQLNKQLSDITVYDIAFCLENSLLFSDGYAGTESLQSFWVSIDDKLRENLTVSIKKLVDHHIQSKQCLSYTI